MVKNNVRPYWYVDLKWLLSLLALAAIAATLLLVTFARITAREPAVKILSYSLAGLTTTDDIDSDAGFEEIKQRVAANGQETVNFGGAPVVITAEDVATLSPRQLRLKIFGGFAEKFYDQGPAGLATDTGATAEEAEKLKTDSSFIAPLTREGHRQITTYAAIAVAVSLALIGLVVLFSYRLGRLVSPGLLLLLTGFPGLLFFAIASSQSDEPIGAARTDTASSTLEAAGTAASFIGPLVMPYFASTYLPVLGLGLLLLLTALVSKLILRINSR